MIPTMQKLRPKVEYGWTLPLTALLCNSQKQLAKRQPFFPFLACYAMRLVYPKLPGGKSQNFSTTSTTTQCGCSRIFAGRLSWSKITPIIFGCQECRDVVVVVGKFRDIHQPRCLRCAHQIKRTCQTHPGTQPKNRARTTLPQEAECTELVQKLHMALAWPLP
jgi:hypothetical protein